MKVNKIYVIAALHGDEVFGLKIMAYLRAHGDPRIITHVGHVEAIAKRRRFIESDLNRSFRDDMEPTLEAHIAKSIVNDIKAHQPDIILDLHTSHGAVGRVAIVPNITPELLDLSERIGMEYVVRMVDNIASLSLIGQFPHTSISVEFGVGNRSDKRARDVAKNIIALLGVKLGKADVNLPTFAVKRKIGLHEAVGEELRNYEFNQTLDGCPFLVGKNTYSEFRGFLAEKL